jgi:hypothetical protein
MADHPHTDDATGENLIEQVAAVGDYLVAARPASPAGRAGSWGYAARYLRIQRAVTATPGVMHFVPSLVPAAHTSDTKSSLSAQLTVSVPVTVRKGGGAPGSPLGPGDPTGPGGPAGPWGPASPR